MKESIPIKINMLKSLDFFYVRQYWTDVCPCLTTFMHFLNLTLSTCAGMVMPSRDYLGLTGDGMVLGQVLM